MLDEYYELRGWRVADGLPTKRVLHRLSLDDLVEDLTKHHVELPD
jgi:aldehyde:ferredoxin oxidoreductase